MSSCGASSIVGAARIVLRLTSMTDADTSRFGLPVNRVADLLPWTMVP